MGKNKLKKFKEMETMECVFQFPFGRLESEGFPLKGKWRSEVFANDNPVVLELGCGKREYAVGLAQRFPGKNFIGVDIKGARMFTGARRAIDLGLGNVAFLRTNIELIDRFFDPGEVNEIWITFPDPQMKKVRKRLTSTRFLGLYRHILRDGGTIHLKSDSPFLYTYTRAMALENGLTPTTDTDNLYAPDAPLTESQRELLGIRTFYEQQWLSRGLTIKYISFNLPAEGELREPDIEIEHDTYRSFSRGFLETHPCQEPTTENGSDIS